MPILSIRLTDEELAQIKSEAEKRGIGISSFIKDTLFSYQTQKANYLTNEIILQNIKNKISCGKLKEPFVLSDVFEQDEYIKYYNFIPAGKAFYKFCNTPGTEAYQLLVPLGGKPAKYILRK